MEIDVRHIAQLAMLKLPEDQVTVMEQEFAAFIAMADCLPKPESPESDDTQWPAEERMALREDIIVPSCSREAMLQNAPRMAEGCIVVPKVPENAETSVKTI